MLTIHKDMPTYTLKNISPELHQALQNAAKAKKRSINSEILDCLEENYLQNRSDRVKQLLSEMEAAKSTDFKPISIEQIVQDIREARDK